MGIQVDSSHTGSDESPGDIDEGLVTHTNQPVKPTISEGVKKQKKVTQNVPRRLIKPSSKIQGMAGLHSPNGNIKIAAQ